LLERILLRTLFGACLASIPFVFKRKNLLMYLIIFFAKGVICSIIESFVIKTNKIGYPVRPFPKIFESNILYDLLFYPLLSVIWVRWSYNSKPWAIILKSLCFSVPMSIAQWIMEKTTNLFKWKSWTIFDTFIYTNFTLFTIRGMVGIIRKFTEKNIQAKINTNQIKPHQILSRLGHVFPLEIDYESENINQRSLNSYEHLQ
jgi:hypothetical protein